MQAFKQRITSALDKRRSGGLERKIIDAEKGNSLDIHVDGKSYRNFSSNDYLGLANDIELVSAWQRGLSLYGAGSGSSPMVVGNCSAHSYLRAQLADWLGYEDTVLFNSGFSANQALIFALMQKNDLLIQDRLNHASLIEAGSLCDATMKRFRHNDTRHLATLLSSGSQPTLVLTEGVFSMDGDLAPLREINETIKNKGLLAVDDAHGIGVLGGDGRGSIDRAGIKPDILIATFGKAFGLSGAAILCSREMADYFSQFARHHVYSTAMPPSQAYTLSHAIKMIQTQQWRRDKLAELSLEYHRHMSDFESECLPTITAIKPVVIGSSSLTVSAAKTMQASGIWTTAIRPPTVPHGAGRLRITITAGHDLNDINLLCSSLSRVLEHVVTYERD
ncbi:8-amino-7-oxononanoate synthase [Vibrio sp.]|nr:8-amino-7-oxononanoate synthase [Vibrio sp.]